MSRSEIADGSNYADPEQELEDAVADGSNYARGDDPGSAPADGSSYDTGVELDDDDVTGENFAEDGERD